MGGVVFPMVAEGGAGAQSRRPAEAVGPRGAVHRFRPGGWGWAIHGRTLPRRGCVRRGNPVPFLSATVGGMAEVRHLAAERHNALCSAWRRLVLHVGGLETLASYLGKAKSHLSEFGAPHTGRSPTVATVLEAEAFAGEPLITAALAAAQGYRLVPIDEPASDAAALDAMAAKLLEEMGEAFTAYAAAQRDRRVTATERRRLEREFGDVELAAARMVAALRGAP